jgi:hypothetical protein
MSGINELVQVIDGMSEADLTRELDELEERVEMIRFALHYKQTRRKADAPPAPQERAHELETERPASRRPPKNRRRAILALMHDFPGKVWRYQEVREAMIERGWLDPDERANHALGVAMSKMASLGQLERPERGYYRLPGPNQPALADERGEDR